MPDRLLDTVLDPDTLLAKLDDLERQCAERPDEQPHPALSQFQSVIAHCLEAVGIEAGELQPTEHGLRHFAEEVRDRLRRYGPCDRSIAAVLADTPDGVDRHVIHLGDTYYSGTEEEYHHLFLPLWPVGPHSPVGSWSLNGNHDMYAGGHGFFKALLGDDRFAAQRRCSYFCLGNERWRFIGLDDSYTDPDNPQLAGSQIEWLSGLMSAAPRPGTGHRSRRRCGADPVLHRDRPPTQRSGRRRGAA